MVKDKKIGDIVCVISPWGTTEKCEITGLFKSYCKATSVDNAGTFCYKLENVYETKEEAMNADRQQIKNDYKKDIHNMDELIDFCLERMSSTEDVAIDVVKERYDELKDEMCPDYFDEYCK